jgi:hypothetical protein
MPGMTLRLEDLDHDLLRILAIVKRKSANQIVIDLLRAEFDRELPGKRESMNGSGSASERLRDVLGLPPVPTDPQGDARLDAALARAENDADRLYGDGGRAAA